MGVWRMVSIAAALAALPGPVEAQRRQPSEAEIRTAEQALAAFNSPTLTRFTGEAEFRRYVGAVRAAARARGRWWAQASGIQFAEAQSIGQAAIQSDTATPVCVPTEANPCVEGAAEESNVIVTGSRIAPRNPSITNNQMRNVEEGDIVKQIDHYLLVLQDGRIFVIDTRARRRRLALTDRANVYRNPRSDMWYDEMLVFGDRVLITGYSYDEGETELAVFRLGPGGRLTREGVFHISSNDYYSGSNYATRLIDGNLVTYTPIDVGDMNRADFKWPVVRRWRQEDDDREGEERERALPGRPLLDAANIYRPARTTYAPMIHTVSVCPLGETRPGQDLECRTTAMAGPRQVQWYVTSGDVYLWTAAEDDDLDRDGDCADESRIALADMAPALLYRVPLSGARPDLIGAWGFPPDQFAMQADASRFFALLRMEPARCHGRYDAPPRLSFVSIPLARLGTTLADAPATAFTPLPSTASRWVASRFTDHYLVYGGLSRFRRGFPDMALNYGDEYRQRVIDELRPRPAYVVPVDRPAQVRPIEVGHTVIRAERVADDIVLTGYRDRGGLMVSLIDLNGPPRLASSVRLAGRYESEGRSHAFNSLIEPDGSGVMGLPTVPRIADSGRDYWRSRASDLSFLEVDQDGQLHPIGELERRFAYVDEYDEATRVEDEDGVPGYQCEVSCIDWYGNSRPIFTDGRVFALSGTELIEGRVANGRIREIQRLNIALTPVPARQAR